MPQVRVHSSDANLGCQRLLTPISSTASSRNAAFFSRVRACPERSRSRRDGRSRTGISRGCLATWIARSWIEFQCSVVILRKRIRSQANESQGRISAFTFEAVRLQDEAGRVAHTTRFSLCGEVEGIPSTASSRNAGWPGAPGSASCFCERTWGKKRPHWPVRLAISRRPFRLDFYWSYFPQRVVAKAAPLPIAGSLYQSTLHRISMQIA